MDNTVLKINGLTVGYKTSKGNNILYSDMDATLKKGELTCLLGKNGTGKSTLLRTLCRLLPPINGSVQVNGKDICQYSMRELSKQIGIVLTDMVRTEDMTAYEVIALGRSPYTGFWGRLSDSDREIIDKSIEQIGISELTDRKMQTLSDGERQKIMIAKAVAQETPVILLDEPSAFLDYASKIKLLQLLHTLTKKMGKTVLVSSHDIEQMLRFSDNVWLLDRERGFTQGETRLLCQNGTIASYFNLEGITFDQDNYRFEIDFDQI